MKYVYKDCESLNMDCESSFDHSMIRAMRRLVEEKDNTENITINISLPGHTEIHTFCWNK